MSEEQHNLEERYEFASSTKKRLLILLVVGIVLTILGIFQVMSAGGEHGDSSHAINADSSILQVSNDDNILVASEAEGESHGSPVWLKRLYVSIWQNNIFFAGLGLIGFVFFAIQYAASAGWSAGFKRVPFAMGNWIPIAGIIAVAMFFLAGKDIFHWMHPDLYHQGTDHFDAILYGKKSYFFWPADKHPGFPVFWFVRLIVFFTAWYWFFLQIRKWVVKEDNEGGTEPWFKMRSLSAIFLVVFAVTSSVAAWDWIMSIDPHWFSTMMGWYTFASWFVAGLALTALLVIYLKEKGLLSIVNANHLHDLGKFIFAFSIFWTYIWFSQYLLIYFANIPEESIYFVERLSTSQYAPVFYLNVIMNFVFPFLLFMTRDSKRHRVFIKIVAGIVLAGHWVDFYLMVTPGTMQYDGGFGFVEIGVTLVFLSLFLYVTLSNLAKMPLIAKNHPMLAESLHHHV